MENGIYKVHVSIMNASKRLLPSACNEGFALENAYIEKTDEKIELYMLTGGVHFGDSFGYCSNIFTGNIDSEDKVEAEYLAYQMDAETGWTQWETDKASYSAHGSAKVRMELNNAYTDESIRQNCYLIGFYVPMMDTLTEDGKPGSGANRQPAILRVMNAEKVDENPLKDYENSAAMGEIDNLEYYIATETGLSQEKKDTLMALFTEAKAEVQSWTEAQSSERVEKLIQLLKAARETDPLKEGIYRIPLDTEKGSAAGLSVLANIEGGKMTLSLTKDSGEAFDSVQYKGLFGDWQTGEFSEDKKTVSYTVSYTEEALPLMLGDSEYTLALDFDHAELISADFTALDEALTSAKEKLETEDSWTASTYQALKAEVETAETLRKNWTAAQSQVDDETKTLAQAVAALKERADLADLKSDITDALKKANDKQYSESSRKALQELVVSIRSEIRDETEVSREAAEDYQNQIAAAVEALTTEEDDKKDDDADSSKSNSLKSFVSDYKSWYQEENYTADSWASFATALSNAETLAENELSDAECEEAIQALMEARAQLVRLTESEDDMAALADTLEEAKDEDTVNYVGLIGYKAWVRSMDVAELAVNGQVLLSKGQASLLDYSLKAQYLAMSAELNAVETADYDYDDWEADWESWADDDAEEDSEWLDEEEYEEEDEDIASGSDVKRTKTVKKSNAYAIALASEDEIELTAEDTYRDGTYTVDYDLMQYSDPSKKSMGNNALDHGTDPGTMIRKDGQWTLYTKFNEIEAYEKTGSLKSMKRITGVSTSDDGYEITGVKDADWPASIPDYPTMLGFHVDYGTTYIDVQVNVPIAPEPTQEAKIKIDWSSLDYVNGVTDIDSTLDFKALNAAVKAAEKLNESKYTSASWAVVEENLTAAAAVESNATSTQDMVDQRAEALNAAVEALLKKAEKSDYTKLDEALTDALIAQESEYSRNAWRELQSIYALADALQSAEDVTPAMIESMVADLSAAVGRTGSDDDDNDSTGLKYGTLENLIKLLESYDSKNYTELSLKQLEKALEYGREILALAKENKCSQSDIDEAVTLLKEAKAKLVTVETEQEKADFAELKVLIDRAKTLLTLKSNYDESTVRSLETEYALAAALLDNENADQEKVEAQYLSLKAAINGLKASSSSSNSSSTTTDSSSSSDTKETTSKDGYYKVKVQLWHANKNQASAGADCISSPAYVMIEDGEITMRLVTKKMNKSGITAHLGEGDFYIYSDGDYVPATLVSTENSRWIHEFTLPNDTSTYYKCEVDPHVDVMGDEPVKARLKITWSSKTKITESTWDKLSGDVSDDDDDDSTSSTTTTKTTTTTGTTTTGTAGTTAAAGTTTAAAQTVNTSSTGSRSTSTTSSKSSTKTAASSTKSSKAADTEKVTTIDGREIPYTGDTTPVNEMAALGILGIVGTLGLVLPRRKRSEEDAA